MTRLPQVILASSSSYRRELLSRLLAEFECVSPDIDEHSFHDESLSPQELALLLARRKAEAVSLLHPAAVVIGSDQLVDLEGEILGKPGDIASAEAQLITMSGRSHRLLTAVAVRTPDAQFSFVNETRLQMRKITQEEVRRYVSRDMPLDCAGSYKIECQGISLFEKVETEDFTAIMGLPLIELSKVMREIGFSVP